MPASTSPAGRLRRTAVAAVAVLTVLGGSSLVAPAHAEEPNTPVGREASIAQPQITTSAGTFNVTVTAYDVTVAGTTTLTTSPSDPTVPGTFTPWPDFPVFAFDSSAQFESARVCVAPTSPAVWQQFQRLTVLSHTSGGWTKVTGGGNSRIGICAQLSTAHASFVYGKPNDLVINDVPDVTVPATSSRGVISNAGVFGGFELPEVTGTSSWDNAGAACTPEAGSRFPLGSTVVTCAAHPDTLASYANVPAPIDFTVTVTGTVGPAVPLGQRVQVFPPDTNTTPPATANAAPIGLTFPVVTRAGTAAVTSSATGPAPVGFEFRDLIKPIYYDVSVDAGFTGPAQVCLAMPGDMTNQLGYNDFRRLRLYQHQGGSWHDVTSLVERGTEARICGTTSTFGTFAMGIGPEPTLTWSFVPQDITVSATSAAGALVSFERPLLTEAPWLTPQEAPCWPWGSPPYGWLFPLGTTTVTCYGNPGEELTFDVTVRGAVTTQTDPGAGVLVFPPDNNGETNVGLSFANVTAPGTTTVVSTSTGPAPSVFQFNGPTPRYYNLSTTAQFQGPVTVCLSLNYDDYAPLGQTVFEQQRLYHYENNAWHDITTSASWSTGRICGATTSFSPFAVGTPRSKPNDLALSPMTNVTVPATSAQGAKVTFAKPATSGSLTGNLAASCARASGTVFPIGTSTVTCTVTDDRYANSPQLRTFTVTVQGAAAQLGDLRAAVTGVGTGKVLQTAVEKAQTQLAAGNTKATCQSLLTFGVTVAAQLIAKKITVAKSVSLAATAVRIGTVLRC